MVEIRFVGHLAEIMGSREIKISLEHPMSLRRILDDRLPEDRTLVIINQQGGTFDSTVREGDKVFIMPVVTGG